MNIQFIDTKPISGLSWFDARDYCVSRGVRLPTDTEWEYAARGPDNLRYPWGNEYIAENVVGEDSAPRGATTLDYTSVGTRPAGASWVGALDMSGNLIEWVSSIALPYPYQTNDGREDLSDTESDRVHRGGSYFSDAEQLLAFSRSDDRPELDHPNFTVRCAQNFDGGSSSGSTNTTPPAEVSEADASPPDESPTITPVTANADWTPVTQEFDGVEMVLVPPGCFTMGDDDGLLESPAHEQCIDAAFWMYRTEVTQANYLRLGGEVSSAIGFNGEGTEGNPDRYLGDDRPAHSITWYEASNFCDNRGGRLPTEAEWEYAARGPDSLVYPWGDEWDENRATWYGITSEQLSTVGSIPEGASWVGALDMSGNVWEWTSTIFDNYPYNADDGRENPDDDANLRVIRGSAYLNEPDEFKAMSRAAIEPDDARFSRGVRCVRDF